MQHVQVTNINNLVRFQNEQSIEQLNITKLDTKHVKFTAILPESLTKNQKINLNFFLISSNNSNLIETKLKIKNYDSSLQQIDLNNEKFHVFETTCELPILDEDSNKQIIYCYNLKDEATSFNSIENLLNERRLLRVLSLKKTNKNFEEKLDGLVLFNNGI